MRIIWSLLLLPLLLSFGGVSSAFAALTCTANFNYVNFSGSSPADIISKLGAYCSDPSKNCSGYLFYQSGSVNPIHTQFTFRPGASGSLIGLAGGCSGACDVGSTYDPVKGKCVNPESERCAALTGQATKWIVKYESQSAYDQNPVRCTSSTDGCAVDTCTSGSSSCGTSGSTGEFACFGTGQYTGEVQAPSSGTDVEGCTSNCEPPKPETTSSSDSCTAPSVANGVTSYTCHSESNSDQFASSDCAVGAVNGVTALHCTSPDYVPESNSKTKDDDITEQPKSTGTGTVKTTDSTEVKTNCKAGNCSSTTTNTTTIEGKDANGNTTDSTTVCTGDRCDDPTTPRDESAEEEGEDVDRLVSGEDCQSTLRCEGDAIDCAAVRQQKQMRCSMDWDLHKAAVQAEAEKTDYELQEDEVDASELFPGSSGRWLSSSCPADRTIHLSLTGSSVTFSWNFVCQYAQALGNLLVALASLFFAVYVGRAFGGD